MTITPERRTATLSELVAEEIRALMGRRRVSQAQLARRIGKTEMWVSLRLRGKQPIDLNDLELVADALQATVFDLMPEKVRMGERSQLNVRWGDVVRTGDAGPAQLVTPRPIAPPRRDSTRPISVIPPSRRRPSPVRPQVTRPMAA